jgi:L-asparaginase
MKAQRILVMATGGTIGTRVSDPLCLLDYPDLGERLSAADLIASLPDAVRQAHALEAVDLSSLYSPDVGTAQWVAWAQAVRAATADPQLAGIVITHGTATLEETAYALDLMLDVPVPIIVTGAQRPLGAIGADGPGNLTDAIRVAASEQARGQGVLVVFNGEIHSARAVTKVSTMQVNGFASAGAGPIGFLDVQGIHWHAKAAKGLRGRFPSDRVEAFPRVDIAYSHAGADGTAITAFVAAGAAGIVSAGVLPGLTASAEWAALLAAKARGVVVVQSVRGVGSRVADSLRRIDNGVISAGSLNPQKARILLMFALAAGESGSGLSRCFAD